jgi:hypothetical protein
MRPRDRDRQRQRQRQRRRRPDAPVSDRIVQPIRPMLYPTIVVARHRIHCRDLHIAVIAMHASRQNDHYTPNARSHDNDYASHDYRTTRNRERDGGSVPISPTDFTNRPFA